MLRMGRTNYEEQDLLQRAITFMLGARLNKSLPAYKVLMEVFNTNEAESRDLCNLFNVNPES